MHKFTKPFNTSLNSLNLLLSIGSVDEFLADAISKNVDLSYKNISLAWHTLHNFCNLFCKLGKSGIKEHTISPHALYIVWSHIEV